MWSYDHDIVKFIDVKVWRRSGLTEAGTGTAGPGPVLSNSTSIYQISDKFSQAR